MKDWATTAEEDFEKDMAESSIHKLPELSDKDTEVLYK